MTENSKNQAVPFPSLVIGADGIQNNEPDKSHLTYQVVTYCYGVQDGERIDTRIQAAIRAAGAVSKLSVYQPDDQGNIGKALLVATRGEVSTVKPDKGDAYEQAAWLMTDNRTKAQGKGDDQTLTAKINGHKNRVHLEPLSIARDMIAVLNPKVSAKSQGRSKVKRLEAQVKDLKAQAEAAAELEALVSQFIDQLPDDARAKAQELRKAAHAAKVAA